ncbi:hypothetical protein GCM10011390_45410 [Aureimonas endophytica]|uniref:Uncharacterized protein n=1 Tax=Aureimonas endophytica TaxID=2027858 RepID=A0A917A0J9_9HYPH|nr:hypothetical protein [Aureimonas endophytica]GGE21050.1 hypothetical protein GCM10011390_45410 [Aureimonas endophytica]
MRSLAPFAALLALALLMPEPAAAATVCSNVRAGKVMKRVCSVGQTSSQRNGTTVRGINTADGTSSNANGSGTGVGTGGASGRGGSVSNQTGVSSSCISGGLRVTNCN